MLKKGITIVVMLAMAICLFGSKPKATKAATELLSPEKMFEIQKNACLAHEELMKSFECNGGIYSYPDDFAGDYIDSGTLYVMSISKEKLNEYKDLLKDYDSVKYEVVTYSYNELMSKALDVSARYSKKYKIIETEVDVKKNRGKIFVTPKDYNDIKKELKDEASDVIVDWTYEATDEASIIAGSTLNNSITLAGSGTYNGCLLQNSDVESCKVVL